MNKFDSMTIGDRIRWLIDNRGYKQTELAESMGLTQSAISNLVTNDSRKPSAPTLLKLASALQANPDWIITGQGEPYQTNTIGRKQEQELLEIFRRMDTKTQLALLAAAKAMAR
jgi:transcriptional regulator with XRE-family HTH domain